MIEELAPDEIDAFLREQLVGRIGCHADGRTYVVWGPSLLLAP